MRYTLDDLKYGGKYHAFFWELNPNATIENCLANCTTLVAGDCLKDNLKPVKKIVNANKWHLYLNDGFTFFPYQKDLVEVGDIIEWENKCHVARVAEITDDIYLNCSWYTGNHGVAVWNGSFDTRNFSSLQEVSDFMVKYYPTRFYHCWDIESECKGVGGQPQYIIRAPHFIKPDEQNTNVNQIEVLTNEQNVREEPNGAIVGVAQKGFYNVYATVYDGKYNWYQIREKRFIAGVNDRVIYVNAKDDFNSLKKENEELRKYNSKLLSAIEKAKKDLEV